MVSFCCVNECKNNTKIVNKNTSGISLHSLPLNVELRQKWLQAIGRPDWDPPSDVRICSVHFTQFQSNSDGYEVQVKIEEASPMYSLPTNSLFEASHVKVCRVCLATEVKMFNIKEAGLETSIKILSGFNDNRRNIEGLPQYVCYECSAQLLKYHKMVEKSVISQTTLLDIFAENCKVTEDLVRQRDRNLLNLGSNLNLQKFGTNFVYTYTYADEINDFGDDLKIKNYQTGPCVISRVEIMGKDQENRMRKRKPPINVTIKNPSSNKKQKIDNGFLFIDIEPIKEPEDETLHCSDENIPINLCKNDTNNSLKSPIEKDKENKPTTSNKSKTTKDAAFTIPRGTTSKKRVKKSKQPGKIDKNMEKLNTCFEIVDLSLEDQITAWKNEIEQEAGPSWMFKCETCSKRFLRKKTYETHIIRHKKSRGEFVCKVCDERFRYASRLEAHTTRIHCKRYECKSCPKVFHNMDSARRHHYHHSVEVHECGQCPFTTKTRSKVWLHRRVEHARDHHCARCGHSFINAKGLATHLSVAHQNPEDEPKGEFRCEECDITFNSEGARRVHILTYKLHKNDGNEKAPLDPKLSAICLLCAATFSTKAELYEHKNKKHPEIKYKYRNKNRSLSYPRKCEHCEEEVKSRQEHYWHVRRTHRSVDYHPDTFVVCEQCGKAYPNTSLLRYHVASHNGGPTYACSVCPKKFFSRPALNRHVVVHTPHKKYSCADCGKAFKERGNLLRHRRMHTGETPYECNVCAKKFKYWQTLDLHMKHVHYQMPWPTRVRRSAKIQKKSKRDGPNQGTEDFCFD